MGTFGKGSILWIYFIHAKSKINENLKEKDIIIGEFL